MEHTPDKFALWLNNYRQENNLTILELSQKCGISPAFMGFILNGKRMASLETLLKISDGLGMQFEDVAYVYALPTIINDEGYKETSYFRINNSRKKIDDTHGAIKTIAEPQLRKLYGSDVSQDFEKYVRKYLADVEYKDSIEEYTKQKFLDKVTPSSKSTSKDTEDTLLIQVISKLYDLDDEGLFFINDQLSIYQKYINKE